jgi:hypothetical protein
MSLARDTALEVMGWKERAGVKTHPHYGWGRPGRPTISAETWRPEDDLTQAFEVLRSATRGQETSILVVGGSPPLYIVESGRYSVGPVLSLGDAICRLSLEVVRDA